MSGNHVPPQLGDNAFNCPQCGAFASQMWDNVSYKKYKTAVKLSKCKNCGDYAVWYGDLMVYPKSVNAPRAHEYMPEAVERDFEEARQVVDASPRAAAALLRLAVQRLLEDSLDTPGDGINADIGHLVEKDRVSPRVKKMLDGVRITGNNSVHPGRMDMDDDRDTAMALFKLLNYIVDETIGKDKEVEEFWQSLPEEDRQGVENRDQ